MTTLLLQLQEHEATLQQQSELCSDEVNFAATKSTLQWDEINLKATELHPVFTATDAEEQT